MTTKKERLIGVLWALAIAGYFILASAIPAWALVIRGIPGSVHQVASMAVDPGDVGKTCPVVATVVNGESTHFDNELQIEASRFTDVEGRPNTTEVFTATVLLDANLTAQVRLSETPHMPPIPAYPEGRSVWSAEVSLSYECPPDEETTTTTTVAEETTTTTEAATTTTTVVVTTTTIPEDGTTTTLGTTTTTLPAGLGFDCETDRIVLWGLYPGEWTVTADGAPLYEWTFRDSSETTWDMAAPESVSNVGLVLPSGETLSVEVDCGWPVTTVTTVPPVTIATLPFTGPPVEAGIAMAAVALLLLGAGIMLAVRES